MSGSEHPNDNADSIAQLGWWFAAGWWFSGTWSFAGVPEGDKVSLLIEMGFVGPVEALHYAPQLSRLVSTQAEIEDILLQNDDGIKTALGGFLTAMILRTSPRAQEFHLGSGIDSHMTPTSRTRFSLFEIADDISRSSAAGFKTYAPSEPSVLPISPIIECEIRGTQLLPVAEHVSLTQNFRDGMKLTVDCPGVGRRRVDVLVVSETTGTIQIETADATIGDRCYIVGVEVSDPVRMINANEFSRWRSGSPVADSGGSRGAFNDELYRLLYAPHDGRLASFSSAELYADYQSNPERVASVADIVSAFRDAPSVIPSTLKVSPGGTIEFAAPSSGVVSGVLTAAALTTTGYENVGDEVEDRIVPTAAAVREIIADACRLSSESKVESETEVALTVGPDGGVKLEGDIECNAVLAGASVQATGIAAVTVSATESIEADRIQCRQLSLPDSIVAGPGTVDIRSHVVSMKDAVARNVRCVTLNSARVDCNEMRASEFNGETVFANHLDVSDTVLARTIRCGVLESGGQDICSTLTRLQSQLDGANRRLASIELDLQRQVAYKEAVSL